MRSANFKLSLEKLHLPKNFSAIKRLILSYRYTNFLVLMQSNTRERRLSKAFVQRSPVTDKDYFRAVYIFMGNKARQECLCLLQTSTHARVNKPGWENRWCVLEGTWLTLHLQEGDASPVDSFDLSPMDADVSVHSAVTSAELSNTASSDVYYVLRLDQDPLTTCWPGR